jgi:hypothetical protein
MGLGEILGLVEISAISEVQWPPTSVQKAEQCWRIVCKPEVEITKYLRARKGRGFIKWGSHDIKYTINTEAKTWLAEGRQSRR